MNAKVDAYLVDGCGRCKLGGTPECKVHQWENELKHLRSIILTCGLTEELKWSVPCYTYKGSNILMLSAFKEYCAVSFFKGSLLKDSNNLLDKPGDNSQAMRLFKITNLNQIKVLESSIKAYIHEAIEIEKDGLKVNFKKITEHDIPEELQQVLDSDIEYKKAFEALTPGRQRGYYIHFSQPKQSKTRFARIEKAREKIFEGKGFNDY